MCTIMLMLAYVTLGQNRF